MELSNILIFDALSKVVGTFMIFFTLLIFVYSLDYIKKNRTVYYTWFFFTFLASLGVAFSRDIFLIIIPQNKVTVKNSRHCLESPGSPEPIFSPRPLNFPPTLGKGLMTMKHAALKISVMRTSPQAFRM